MVPSVSRGTSFAYIFWRCQAPAVQRRVETSSPLNLLKTARRMAPSLSRGIPFVYILRLRSGSFYVGCSTDFEARFREHEHGTACRTTAIDPPKALLFIEIHRDFPTARQREAQIKLWSRAKKQALINADLSLLQRLGRSRE